MKFCTLSIVCENLGWSQGFKLRRQIVRLHLPFSKSFLSHTAAVFQPFTVVGAHQLQSCFSFMFTGTFCEVVCLH